MTRAKTSIFNKESVKIETPMKNYIESGRYNEYTISGFGEVRKLYIIVEERQDDYYVELVETNKSMYSGSGYFTTINKSDFYENQFGYTRLVNIKK